LNINKKLVVRMVSDYG